MQEMAKHGNIKLSSMKAGLDRKTGAKYIKSGMLPSEHQKRPRTYLTRADAFNEHWGEIVTKLQDAPELEGKALFEWLSERYPGTYEPGQLRTFQRRLKKWRATYGPEKEVFFAQCHRPGEALQVDFTHCNKLRVTIVGKTFDHMICHSVLPYSNWEWATVCFTESLMALRGGVQEALFRLGRTPEYIQTDSLSAATHSLGAGERDFNTSYCDFLKHYGIKPRRIAIGKCNQNGDVESSNNALKRRLEQHLLLRGNRDFQSREEYELFVQSVVYKANEARTTKATEEIEIMKEISVSKLHEYREQTVRVSRESTVSIMQNCYSVPSRLCGERLKACIYDDRIELYLGGSHQLTLERIFGKQKHRISYRHVVFSLVKKPGAFARYRYREELFPGIEFRRTYEVLHKHSNNDYKADLEYLRILKRAAEVNEEAVRGALQGLLADGIVPDADTIDALVTPARATVPSMKPYTPKLSEYDTILNTKKDAQEVIGGNS